MAADVAAKGGKRDGKISANDLQAFIDGKKAPPSKGQLIASGANKVLGWLGWKP